MRACRHGLSAALLCVAAMTACTAAAELPTLEDAARQLDSDGGALLGSAGLRLSTESPADDDSCVPGQVRRYFRAESDLASASALLDRLQAMGYDKVVDDLDLRDGDQDVSVLRNPETRLTFELTVLSGDEPGVRVIGKTTCYTAD
ncbi:hypothetical protein ACFPOI_00720 [Nonomuraea angiospora]|uniref:Lipoprotein n=1 Tax=Nonomuraea angiospora TaxID=46172 RepID=A0ABR9M1Y7_9ACTN|nr:hypothetical protein [Nonomuraea angiospora]MBE1586926.1 hypothetical protein [Nonomuraea angiospora]